MFQEKYIQWKFQTNLKYDEILKIWIRRNISIMIKTYNKKKLLLLSREADIQWNINHRKIFNAKVIFAEKIAMILFTPLQEYKHLFVGYFFGN